MRGEFAPGERLDRARPLASVTRSAARSSVRRCGTSRPTVWSASVANKGPEVARVSRSDVVALYEVRGVLEGLAGKLFAERATADQSSGLGEALDVLAAALQQRANCAEVLEAKDGYYDTLLEGAAATR